MIPLRFIIDWVHIKCRMHNFEGIVNDYGDAGFMRFIAGSTFPYAHGMFGGVP